MALNGSAIAAGVTGAAITGAKKVGNAALEVAHPVLDVANTALKYSNPISAMFEAANKLGGATTGASTGSQTTAKGAAATFVASIAGVSGVTDSLGSVSSTLADTARDLAPVVNDTLKVKQTGESQKEAMQA